MDHVIIIVREENVKEKKKPKKKEKRKITKLVNITTSPRAPFSLVSLNYSLLCVS